MIACRGFQTLLALLVLVGCEPEEGTDDSGDVFHVEDSGDDGGADGGEGDGGNDDGGDDGTDDTGDDGTGTDGDFDGDGWTVEDGDCDDYDDEANPAQNSDPCDGVNNDCDDETDEDFAEDEYEPNDDVGYDLGDMSGASGVVYGFLYPSTEWDLFEFYVEDGWWDIFGIEVNLAGVPIDSDLGIGLYWMDENGDWQLLDEIDQAGLGAAELLEYGGSSFTDDSGTYAVMVFSTTGESCSESYALEIGG